MIMHMILPIVKTPFAHESKLVHCMNFFQFLPFCTTEMLTAEFPKGGTNVALA
jgi:hypothetical protein